MDTTGITPERFIRYADCHPDRKHYCKGLCSTCYEARRRYINPDRNAYMIEYLKRYYESNPVEHAKRYAARQADPVMRARDKISKKNWARKSKYGLNTIELKAMLEGQESLCALCSQAITDTTMIPDHCHESGKVRGLICRRCNTGLGLFGDNIEGLRRAIDYLERSER
jgi:hypothetical protein